jgi:hypothetical protein
MTLPQCTSLSPIADMHFQRGGKGRIMTFGAGERLWVANSQTDQARTGQIEVCRMRQSMGQGNRFTPAQIGQLFRIEES